MTSVSGRIGLANLFNIFGDWIAITPLTILVADGAVGEDKKEID
jgi:hypothetical protein